MSEAYDEPLAALRGEITSGGANSRVIDAAVAKILATNDPRIARDLLSCLSDRADHDEGMFSLIHAAESFDDATYVRALLEGFDKLVLSAPRWASIVLMRVLNSTATKAELVIQLHSAPSATKGAIANMCERINGVSPEFLSKTVVVMVAAKERVEKNIYKTIDR